MRQLLVSVDAWQRRHTPAAVPVAVVKKFGEDRASSLAALISYYGFLSLFPLLLAFVSILGFALEDDPALQEDILGSALVRIPVIGAQLRDDVEPLTGSTVALVVGLAGALWAGLGVTVALGRAFDRIWGVPGVARRGMIRARIGGFAMLALLGAALVASTVASGLGVEGRIDPFVVRAATLGASLAVNGVVFLGMFWLLTARTGGLREVLPGVAVASVGALVLQGVGGWYVERTITRSSDTYGVFALVIGLLSWFWLGAHLLLGAAELNVVLHRRLWPRSLSGDLEAADREAMRRSAAAAQQDPRELITVEFAEGSFEAGDAARPPRA
jgi:membrane protein